MKKTITATGANGTVEGTIIVSLNYSTISKEVSNGYTHEENTKVLNVHKVEAFVNGSLWKSINELTTTSEVEKQSKTLENQLSEHLHFLANKQDATPFEQKMKNHGYF